MNKRGFSPLIISVILVGIVFVFSAIIYIWVFGVFDVIEEKPLYNAEFIDFGIRYSGLEDCEDSSDRCYSDGAGLAYYCLLIENRENFDVGYIIKTVGNSGVDISNNCTDLLDPLSSSIFRVDYNPDLVGQLDYSEVLPYKYE